MFRKHGTDENRHYLHQMASQDKMVLSDDTSCNVLYKCILYTYVHKLKISTLFLLSGNLKISKNFAHVKFHTFSFKPVTKNDPHNLAKRTSSAPSNAGYILRLGQVGQVTQKHQRLYCPNREMYLEI